MTIDTDILTPDLLARLFHINPEPMTLTRMDDGRYIEVNESFLRVFGYRREEVIGRTALELGIWADLERDRGQIVDQIRDKGFASGIEAEFCTKSGDRIRFYLGATTLETEIGPLLMIAGRDVTALRLSEEALRQSEARFRGLIEHLPLGVLIAQDGLIRYANAASLQMIDYTLPEVLGLPFLQMVYEQDRPMVLDYHRRRMQGDRTDFCYDLRVLRRDGAVCYWRVHASADQWEGKAASLVVCADVTRQKLAELRMTELALHDQITGLPNRTLLEEHALQEIAQSARGFALVYLDLDGFKAVNDQSGHAAGDEVLKVVARRLRRSIREADTASRVGGDEFVVLLRHIDDYHTATRVAENIRLVVGRPITILGVEHRIGASIGISLYPQDGKGLPLLMKHADEAMYRAKRNGRNRVCCFGEEVQEQEPQASRPGCD